MKQENSPLTEINRNTFFFGTAWAPAFPGNLKEYSIDNVLYTCEKPFRRIFEPQAAVRCRSAEAEAPTRGLSADCRFFIAEIVLSLHQFFKSPRHSTEFWAKLIGKREKMTSRRLRNRGCSKTVALVGFLMLNTPRTEKRFRVATRSATNTRQSTTSAGEGSRQTHRSQPRRQTSNLFGMIEYVHTCTA